MEVSDLGHRNRSTHGHANGTARRLGALAIAFGVAVASATFLAPFPLAGPAHAAVSTKSVVVYDGRFGVGWQDFGWSPRTVGNGRAAEIDMADFGGWIIVHPGPIPASYASLRIDYSAPDKYAGALAIRVGDDRQSKFPELALQKGKPDAKGVRRITIPFSKLNPAGLNFDRIIVRTLTKLPAKSIVRVSSVSLTSSGEAPKSMARAGAAAKPLGSTTERLSIDCAAARRPINPQIYGIAYDAIKDATSPQQWTMGATARRWGGNPTSRYNPQIHAWNTALDYFFRNIDVASHKEFIAANRQHQLGSVLTVPMIGWVAKDASSYSFPVASFGPQQYTDPAIPDAGNGSNKDGKKLSPSPPETTSVAFGSEAAGQFANSVKDDVDYYILDNEPEIWNTTHRDVHPNPLSYDELLQRTLDYGAAVRRVDPTAKIAGPSSWGWLGYAYSGVDAAAGFSSAPDRAAHGGQPLIAWYLAKLREHERQTGTRLLDILDVHFYPAADGLYGQNGRIDASGSQLRIRSTRGLWDPSYKDESWIDEPIELLPRLRKWIDDNYPGTGMSIGEWNFGAESHMSGGLATAEALGRFGTAGVTSAFYWTYPPDNTPTYWAFRAFRNYDGKGGRFGDTSVKAEGTWPSGPTSLFASVDGAGRMTAVALNLSGSAAAVSELTLRGCAGSTVTQHSYDGNSAGFRVDAPLKVVEGKTTVTMQPWSINVLVLS